MLAVQLVWGQTMGIPYQAVILSDEPIQELPGLDFNYENPLRNSFVSMRFSIRGLSSFEFEEIHDSVLVDGYGMVNLVVGQGRSTFSNFNNIKWDGNQKWLKVQIDFKNDGGFEDLDYLPIYGLPSHDNDNQNLYISNDTLQIDGGEGVSILDLLENVSVAGNQQISLLGNVLYLENGGSVDLTDIQIDTTSLSNRIDALSNLGGANTNFAVASDSLVITDGSGAFKVALSEIRDTTDEWNTAFYQYLQVKCLKTSVVHY